MRKRLAVKVLRRELTSVPEVGNPVVEPTEAVSCTLVMAAESVVLMAAEGSFTSLQI